MHSFLVTSLTALALSLPAIGGEMLEKPELIERLKEGGLVVYFRHASTEKDYADQVTADPNNGATQRVLSEKGWNEAVHIGNAFRFHSIPVGEVISSEYFRAWQTAYLAFGKYQKDEKLNFLPFEDYTDEQVQQMKETITPYLAEKPSEGSNFIMVGHDDLFEAATGIYPEPQGVAHIIEPLGEGTFKVLGAIKPTEW